MKLRILHIALALLILIGWTGCRKADIPLAEDGPVSYFAKGSLDGQPLNIEAGVDGVVLDATHRRNEYGVDEYIARFKRLDASSQEELRIFIQGNERSPLPNQHADVETSLSTGSYEFQSQQYALDSLRLQLYTPENENYTYQWLVNGVPPQNGTSAAPVLELDQVGSIETKLYITNEATGCEDSLIQTHDNFDESNEFYAFYSQPFNHEIQNDGGIRFTYEGESIDEEIIDIEFLLKSGGLTFTESGITDFVFYPEDEGLVEVIMNVVLATEGEPYAFRYIEKVAQNPDDCAVKIVYEPIPTNEEVSKIRVEYVDPSGELWTSFHPDVLLDAPNFEILNVRDARTATLSNEDAKEATVTFNCRLFKESDPTQTMMLENMESTLAVSFPQ